MIWLMEILKIYLEEQLLIKSDKAILLQIQNMVDIKEVQLQWFISFSVQKL